MAIYFLTYGDDKYHNSKIRIKEEAINFGMFDDIKIYGPEDIGTYFSTITKPYIDNQKGGGYWLWKSFLLKKTFDMMSDGDYCVYVDSGCMINELGKDRFKDYLSLLDKRDSGIFRFSFPGTKEEVFTSSKVFDYFKENNHIYKKSDRFLSTLSKTDHLMATILIFKKCEISTEYVNKFYEISMDNPDIFSDKYNDYNKHKNFVDHRHDQSVSSCLAKVISNDLVIIPDETYTTETDGHLLYWDDLIYNKKIPFLATRIRG
jgi:hypothetical protein